MWKMSNKNSCKSLFYISYSVLFSTFFRLYHTLFFSFIIEMQKYKLYLENKIITLEIHNVEFKEKFNPNALEILKKLDSCISVSPRSI